MIDKQFIVERQGKQFVLYAGLLDVAHSQGLRRISTQLVQVPNDDNGQVAIVSATVETERGVYSGIGDASPANVARAMLICTIRLAETRAKARALRDATNIGVAAVEELADDAVDDTVKSATTRTTKAVQAPAIAVATPNTPTPIDSGEVATASQKSAITRLAQVDGVTVDVDRLTKAQASREIRRLQEGRPA